MNVNFSLKKEARFLRYIIEIFMERTDACICDLPKATLERESMFIRFLPFLFFLPLVPLYIYVYSDEQKLYKTAISTLTQPKYKTIFQGLPIP